MSIIVGPDCRDSNHQKCRGDAWDEDKDQITECQCTCHAETGAGQRIQVWETEDAVLVIWGTHNPIDAFGAALDWYEANSEVPDGLAAEIHNAFVTGQGLYCADPAVLDIEDATWPIELTSREHVQGWTPYLVVSW